MLYTMVFAVSHCVATRCVVCVVDLFVSSFVIISVLTNNNHSSVEHSPLCLSFDFWLLFTFKVSGLLSTLHTC